MEWTPSDDHVALLCIAVLVVSLLVIRSCIPPELHHPSERVPSPPESLYESEAGDGTSRCNSSYRWKLP
jgi:hypothetical protein